MAWDKMGEGLETNGSQPKQHELPHELSGGDFGCLPFTKKIRKFRLECKWKD